MIVPRPHLPPQPQRVEHIYTVHSLRHFEVLTVPGTQLACNEYLWTE
jgi:hypothetical protein